MIPIFDSARSRGIPYVNITFIAINFLVFFYELYLSNQPLPGGLTELDRFIARWGNVPACTFDAGGWDRGIVAENAICNLQPRSVLTPITAMFMHLGWLHILGNMLFLWVFGDNVEDAMGHVLYAIFYLLVGVLAALAHGLTDLNSLIPAVGASGAVAGVMGAYIVVFPRSIVTAVIPPLFFLPLPIPAALMIAIWFVGQLISGFSSLGFGVADVGTEVAYFAHIGGFVAGAVLVNLFAFNRPRRRNTSRYPLEDAW
jgi:membrane associated rhomboid family serine protease